MDWLDSFTAQGEALFGGAWPVVWALIRIVAVVAPLMACVAYLTLWERKFIGFIQLRLGPNRVGPLGGMYNPVYFNYGIAVHGAKNVPREPASHGCIRINMDIAEYFPDLVKVGDAVYVWGHDGKEPEGYTRNESLPSFNQPDPTATTTTSTTTTVKSTTTVPASTTTKPPATTTTTKPPATTTTTTTPPATTTTTTAPPG